MIDLVSIGAGGGSIAYIDSARRLPRRTALGGRRAGPGLLRQGRHGADRHRRAGRARPARRRQDARRRPAARCRPRAQGRRSQGGEAARPVDQGRGARHHQGHQLQHGARHPLELGGARHRSARLRAGAVRRRRAAARRRAGRGDRARRRSSCRLRPASRRRWDCCRPTCSTSMRARSSSSLKHADEAAIARINAVIDELVERCRRDLEKDGVTAERQKFQKLAECRYHGQGFELRAAASGRQGHGGEHPRGGHRLPPAAPARLRLSLRGRRGRADHGARDRPRGRGAAQGWRASARPTDQNIAAALLYTPPDHLRRRPGSSRRRAMIAAGSRRVIASRARRS